MGITKAQIKFVKSLQQKKFRDESHCFVAEGAKAVHELQSAFTLELLVNPDNASSKEIEQMSGMRTPQGVIAVFKQRTEETPIEQLFLQENNLVLALDGVQDPGNLGTIIRTADWFGIKHIVCSHETADCYNPKVVQATMGALARVQLHYTDLLAWLDSLHPSTPIYGTLLEGKNIYEQSLSQHGVIIMGNEGYGITDAIRKKINSAICIPSYPANAPTSESLNVAIATAITLAEFRRNH